MKLSDDEQQKLGVLERALKAEDPRLDQRLTQMQLGGPASLSAVLTLSFAVMLGVLLVTLGDLYAIPGCFVTGLVLTAAVPALTVIWWARRYYCRYCAGKSPTPANWCTRCARSTPV
ncbi:DUF3040 domain-containing protein [Kribbella sp. NPDC054772]